MKTIEELADEIRGQVSDEAAPKYKDSLAGYCAIAAGKLFNALKSINVHPTINIAIHPEDDWAHVYLTVNDTIVDATAGQFSIDFKEIKPIEIRDKKTIEAKYWFWHSCKKLYSTYELKNEQIKKNWPAHQRFNG